VNPEPAVGGGARAASRQSPRRWRGARPAQDNQYRHIKPRKTRTRFLQFCRYPALRLPAAARFAAICDNLSPTWPPGKASAPASERRSAALRSAAPRPNIVGFRTNCMSAQIGQLCPDAKLSTRLLPTG
jgi:hypothetical protein